MKNLTIEQLILKISELKAGGKVALSGTVYTARDAAHKKFAELLAQKKPLPVDLKGAVLYYCGPCPAKPGSVIGSCGPTTASRMDAYTPLMLACGVRGFIGKGPRSEQVRQALRENGGVYFAATGGVAALFAGYVKKAEVVAFPEFGTEAVHKLEIRDFPLTVACDAGGGNIFKK